MDFRGMKRRELQALCKKHKIPANLTNEEMATRLSTLLMEKEKFLTTWRSCLKGLGENGSEKECDIENRQIKKVRFSPENELIEFKIPEVNPLEITRRGRQKSGIHKDCILENVSEHEVNEAVGYATRSKSQNLKEDGVIDRKKGKIAIKDDSMANKLPSDIDYLAFDNDDHERNRVATRRSLRNREVVDEKRSENQDVEKKVQVKFFEKTRQKKQKSAIQCGIVENVSEPEVNQRVGHANRSRSQNVKEGGVIDGTRGKIAIKDNSVANKSPSDVDYLDFGNADDERNGAATRRSLRNREMLDEKRSQNKSVDKKVRFSPENEVIEFEKQEVKSFGITRQGRQKSMILNDNIDRRSGKIAFKDNSMLNELPSDVDYLACSNADRQHNEVAKRRSLRNREVVDEKRNENENENMDKVLKKNGRRRTVKQGNLKCIENVAECETVQTAKVLRRSKRNPAKVKDCRLLTMDAGKNEVVESGRSSRAEATVLIEASAVDNENELLVKDGPLVRENERRLKRNATVHKALATCDDVIADAKDRKETKRQRRDPALEEAVKIGNNPSERPHRRSARNAQRSEKAVPGLKTRNVSQKETRRSKKPENCMITKELHLFDAQSLISDGVKSTISQDSVANEVSMDNFIQKTKASHENSSKKSCAKMQDKLVEVTGEITATEEIRGPDLEQKPTSESADVQNNMIGLHTGTSLFESMFVAQELNIVQEINTKKSAGYPIPHLHSDLQLPGGTAPFSCNAFAELEQFEGSNKGEEKTSARNISSADCLPAIDQVAELEPFEGSNKGEDKTSADLLPAIDQATELEQFEDHKGEDKTSAGNISSVDCLPASDQANSTAEPERKQIWEELSAGKPIWQRPASIDHVAGDEGISVENAHENIVQEDGSQKDGHFGLAQPFDSEGFNSALKDCNFEENILISKDTMATSSITHVPKFDNDEEMTSTAKLGITAEQRVQSPTERRNGCEACNVAAEEDRNYVQQEVNCNKLHKSDEERSLETQHDSAKSRWEACVADSCRSATRTQQYEIINDVEKGGAVKHAYEEYGSSPFIEPSKTERFTLATKYNNHEWIPAKFEDAMSAKICGTEKLTSTLDFCTSEKREQYPMKRTGWMADISVEQNTNYDQEEPNCTELPKSDEDKFLEEQYDPSQSVTGLLEGGSVNYGEKDGAEENAYEKDGNSGLIEPSQNGRFTSTAEEKLTSTIILGPTPGLMEQSQTVQRNSCEADNADEEYEICDQEEINYYDLPKFDDDTPLDEQYDSPNKYHESSVSNCSRISATRMLPDGIISGGENSTQSSDLIKKTLGSTSDAKSAVFESSESISCFESKDPTELNLTSNFPEQTADAMDSVEYLELRKESPSMQGSGAEVDDLAVAYNKFQDEKNCVLEYKNNELNQFRQSETSNSSGSKLGSQGAQDLNNGGDSVDVSDSQGKILAGGWAFQESRLKDEIDSMQASCDDKIHEDLRRENMCFNGSLSVVIDELKDLHGSMTESLNSEGNLASDFWVTREKEISGSYLGKDSDPISLENSNGEKINSIIPSVAASEEFAHEREEEVIRTMHSEKILEQRRESLSRQIIVCEAHSVAEMARNYEPEELYYADLDKFGEDITLNEKFDSPEECWQSVSSPFRTTSGTMQNLTVSDGEDFVGAAGLQGKSLASPPVAAKSVETKHRVIDFGENISSFANTGPSESNFTLEFSKECTSPLNFGVTLEQREQSPSTWRIHCAAESVAEEYRNYEQEELNYNNIETSSGDTNLEKQFSIPDKCCRDISVSDPSRSAMGMLHYGPGNGGEDSNKPADLVGISFVSPFVADKTGQEKCASTSGSGITETLRSNVSPGGQEDLIDTMNLEDSEVGKQSLGMQENSFEADYVVEADKSMYLLNVDCNTASGEGRKEQTDTLQPSEPTYTHDGIESSYLGRDGGSNNFNDELNHELGTVTEGINSERNCISSGKPSVVKEMPQSCFGGEKMHIESEIQFVPKFAELDIQDPASSKSSKFKHHETLRESEIADTIKECMDSESTVNRSPGIDNASETFCTEMMTEVAEETVLLNPETEKSEETVDSAGTKYKPSTEGECDVEKEEQADQSLANANGATEDAWIYQGKIDSAKRLKSAGRKKSIRTILIHGTPNKLQMPGDMKENLPSSKIENIGSMTTVKPSTKRPALRDLLWK